MRVQIGADWDRDKCVVAWKHGKKTRYDKVLRNLEAVKAFVEKVVRVTEPDSEAGIEVAIEAGDRYWLVLWQSAGADVFVFDGRKTRRFAESLCSSAASDDRRSADALLGMLASQAHRNNANVQMPDEVRSLMKLLAIRKQASDAANEASNRLWAALRDSRPSLDATGKQLRSQWLLDALAAAPTASVWNGLEPERQRELLAGSRSDRREAISTALGKDVIAVTEVMETAVQLEIQMAIDVLNTMRRWEKVAEAKLKAALEASETLAHVGEISGIGPVIKTAMTISFGIAHEQTKASGLTNRDAAAMILGAAPVTRRSGVIGDASPKASMRRAGNALLRAIPYLLGLQLSNRHRWAKAAYAHYKARGKSAADAFRCITRSFLRVVQAMERDGLAFDEERYITALKSKGVEWAMAL